MNAEGFLDYLSDDERFALAETIYVPCGNADKLLYGDVKARFPAMNKLIHRTSSQDARVHLNASNVSTDTLICTTVYLVLRLVYLVYLFGI